MVTFFFPNWESQSDLLNNLMLETEVSLPNAKATGGLWQVGEPRPTVWWIQPDIAREARTSSQFCRTGRKQAWLLTVREVSHLESCVLKHDTVQQICSGQLPVRDLRSMSVGPTCAHASLRVRHSRWNHMCVHRVQHFFTLKPKQSSKYHNHNKSKKIN